MATPISGSVVPSEIAHAVEAGRRAAVVADRLGTYPLVEGDGVPVAINSDGNIRVAGDLVDALEALREGPRRRAADVRLHDLESFLAYLKRYRHPDETVVFADPSEFSVAAILDYHPAGPDTKAARWARHRAVYTCPRSPEWIRWTEHDGRPRRQDAFADFIESHLDDLTSSAGSTKRGDAPVADYPSPIAILEMARNLSVRTSGTFRRVIDPTTGTGILECKTEHGAESTKIPRAFLLALRVFEGGEPYRVEARLRFELRDGAALFTYVLHRRAEIERDAFGDVRKAVAATGAPVFAGVME